MLGRSVIIRWVVVAVIVLGAMTWGYIIITENRPKELLLPVYGPKNSDSTDHKISDFSLINQDGKVITQENFKDKIYVADFFFTTCPGICPVMTDQLVRVADRFQRDENILILSHTVKPEEDSLPALKAYAQEHNADPGKWFFVTGPKKQINKLARIDYMVGGSEGQGDEDFVHTQYFALIDPERRIRGFYDGTDSSEVNKLIDDIIILMHEK